MSTVHANGTADALRRLETMVLLSGVDIPAPVVRDLVVSAVDLVVQVTRAANGARHVTAIDEVVAHPDAVGSGEPISRTHPLLGDGRLVALPRRPRRTVEVLAPLDDWVGR